jgi:tetratricopeptide (TPR) repeat protein
VRDGERALTQAAAEAPPAGRGQARMNLARFLLANGLDHEAAGILTVAAAEDPALPAQRAFTLLQGIAQARARRDAVARRLLAQDTVSQDPEAVLWRAYLDARARQWAAALAGFRRSGALLERYADDLQVTMRSAAAQAALETNDLAYAAGELAAAGQLAPEGIAREGLALLRARLDEASGSAAAAREAYRALAAGAERPVAAEAALRGVSLALRDRAIEPEAAIAQLETVSVTWRGDEIEIAALGVLGRLYADGGRWREAFTTARRAGRIYPDHAVTRALHEETGRAVRGSVPHRPGRHALADGGAGAVFRLQGVHADRTPRRRDRAAGLPTASSNSTSSLRRATCCSTRSTSASAGRRARPLRRGSRRFV